MREDPPERVLFGENLRDARHAGAEPCGSAVHELAAHGERVFLLLDFGGGAYALGLETVGVVGTALDGEQALVPDGHVAEFLFGDVDFDVDVLDG